MRPSARRAKGSPSAASPTTSAPRRSASATACCPSNTGRGYVLRKLIRRAVLDGGRLGKKAPFLYRLVPVVARVMEDQYPDLAERRENIARLIRIEEEGFHQTLDRGQAILQELVEKLRAAGEKKLPGSEAFRLFDTYGLPLDVTQSLLEDEGMTTDADEFESEMGRQRERARKGTKISADIFGGGPIAALKERGAATVFEGYEKDESEGAVIGIVVGQDLRDEVGEGREAMIVLDRTSYYGESGGEVGDAGLLLNSGARFEVSDSQRAEGMVLHVGKVLAGRIRLGDKLTTRPDVARRAAIRRNHTATHLMHHALREVLGRHAEQAGSLVAPERLRFDFHHTQAVTERGAAAHRGEGQREDPGEHPRRLAHHAHRAGEGRGRDGALRREIRRRSPAARHRRLLEGALRRAALPRDRRHRPLPDRQRELRRGRHPAHRGGHRAGGAPARARERGPARPALRERSARPRRG